MIEIEIVASQNHRKTWKYPILNVGLCSSILAPMVLGVSKSVLSILSPQQNCPVINFRHLQRLKTITIFINLSNLFWWNTQITLICVLHLQLFGSTFLWIQRAFFAPINKQSWQHEVKDHNKRKGATDHVVGNPDSSSYTTSLLKVSGIGFPTRGSIYYGTMAK